LDLTDRGRTGGRRSSQRQRSTTPITTCSRTSPATRGRRVRCGQIGQAAEKPTGLAWGCAGEEPHS
jgi:hypothetical protein